MSIPPWDPSQMILVNGNQLLIVPSNWPFPCHTAIHILSSSRKNEEKTMVSSWATQKTFSSIGSSFLHKHGKFYQIVQRPLLIKHGLLENSVSSSIDDFSQIFPAVNFREFYPSLNLSQLQNPPKSPKRIFDASKGWHSCQCQIQLNSSIPIPIPTKNGSESKTGIPSIIIPCSLLGCFQWPLDFSQPVTDVFQQKHPVQLNPAPQSQELINPNPNSKLL